jgi:hypothetical protein
MSDETIVSEAAVDIDEIILKEGSCGLVDGKHEFGCLRMLNVYQNAKRDVCFYLTIWNGNVPLRDSIIFYIVSSISKCN